MFGNNINHYSEIRQIVLNTNEPLIVRNQAIGTELLGWSLEKWGQVLGEDTLEFRCGKNKFTNKPQWESTCSKKKAKFKEFLNAIEAKQPNDEWWYFDYKYLCHWFIDKELLQNGIDWSPMGFPEITAKESTLWIGSKGAHTPCHMDTYGCNMVLQLFGRKLWLLFPPEQNLKPSRIPFEESSIYSKLNFFSPDLTQFKGINQCRKIILEPGDILIIPNKWWHYVENLETSISINAWLPLPQDDFERVKESVAAIFVSQMVHNFDHLKNTILNPNSLEEMISSEAALKAIAVLKDKCKRADEASPSPNVETLLSKFDNIERVRILSEPELKIFMRNQLDRFERRESVEESLQHKEIIHFLDVVTNDEVLDFIANKLIANRHVF